MCIRDRDADLTLILLDTSDSLLEARRKLETTRREVLERQDYEADGLDEVQTPHVVLTKIDATTAQQQRAVSDLVMEQGFPEPVAISSMTGEGIDKLQHFIREQLFGAPVFMHVHPPTTASGDASERIISSIYDQGMVESVNRLEGGTVVLNVWMTAACQAQLLARWGARIDIK